MQQCLFCGHLVELVHVHGHYQCPVCCINALPCCDGDNCDTNMLFKEVKAIEQKEMIESHIANEPGSLRS
jgi:hypothetical protein